jgi:chromate transporter
MSEAPPHGVPFRDALRLWVQVGLNSFGGPAGQIAVMHRLVVDERRWVSEARFLHALNYCMLLPGPEAQQLATYLGWLLHGYRGGLVAGILFVLPGFVAILALTYLYVGFRDVRAVEALLFGLKAGVLAVVLEAVLRIGRRVAGGPATFALAVTAFVALFFFAVPFPLVVLTAGVFGLALPGALPLRAPARDAGPEPVIDRMLDRRASHLEPSLARAARVAAVCLALWLVPLAGLWLVRGPDDVFTQVGVFFSKTAVVTFGGAYAVLAYIAQRASATYGWLTAAEMLDGLGMAETTPGPLIQVVQFVGFLAAYRNPGTLPPLVAGTCAAVLTTWVTYVPCFLFVFVGAPWIEALRGNARLASALSAITAAVVGVILNLAVWFGLHVLFGDLRTVPGLVGAHVTVPVWATFQWFPAALAIGAFVALVRFHRGMIPTLAVSAALGAAYRLLAA